MLPSTDIYLLKGVPLNNKYIHTIYFDNLSQQISYFLNENRFAKDTLSEYTYQRTERNKIKIKRSIGSVYNVNYLIFRNTAYENKYFFAFVTDINYINDNTTEIEYEIDVMQTWAFDYTLNPCFVEREHTVSDEKYLHTLPEPPQVSIDYINSGLSTFDLSDMVLGMLVSKEPDGSAVQPLKYAGYYSGIEPILNLPIDADIGITNALIESYTSQGHENAILSIYQYPSWCSDNSTNIAYNHGTFWCYPNTTLNGYVPKNNKLFCYPYTFLKVSNNTGTTKVFKWENWNSTQRGLFEIHGIATPTPSVTALPSGYTGISKDYDNSISIENFPQCAWTGDVFANWLNQTQGSVSSALIKQSLAMVGSTFALNLAGYAAPAAAVAGIGIDLLTKHYAAEQQPPQVHGNGNVNTLQLAMQNTGFYFYQMTIKAEQARVIDDFFTMFGYSCQRVKVPNRKARPYWTYTKTNNCFITCATGHGVPNDDVDKICQIYDNGVTFWTTIATVGDYSYNNTPNE